MRNLLPQILNFVSDHTFLPPQTTNSGSSLSWHRYSADTTRLQNLISGFHCGTCFPLLLPTWLLPLSYPTTECLLYSTKVPVTCSTHCHSFLYIIAHLPSQFSPYLKDVGLTNLKREKTKKGEKCTGKEESKGGRKEKSSTCLPVHLFVCAN